VALPPAFTTFILSGSIPRSIFETPDKFLPQVAPYIWSTAVPGYPIEGHNSSIPAETPPGNVGANPPWRTPQPITLQDVIESQKKITRCKLRNLGSSAFSGNLTNW
jgi:hypothetical protein